MSLMTSQDGFLTYQPDVCVEPAWKGPFIPGESKRTDGFPNSFSLSKGKVDTSANHHVLWKRHNTRPIQQEQVHKLSLIHKLKSKKLTTPPLPPKTIVHFDFLSSFFTFKPRPLNVLPSYMLMFVRILDFECNVPYILKPWVDTILIFTSSVWSAWL